jgi:queuine tRNA-ribosyltransferase
MQTRLGFKIEATCPGTQARAAVMQTLHGEVQTPVFMPVGTQATVKAQTVETLKTAGTTVLLANTYHLLLRPGPEVLKQFGGIHRFMNWSGPVLTDSGGYQIFSLPHARQMNEEGARFSSYVDKKEILLTPEISIQTQRTIQSDIMMVLDQCIPSTSPYDFALSAMDLTHRWAKRSLIAAEDTKQALFAIVQGACFSDLRKKSAEALQKINVDGVGFDGYAIGGLAVGETKSEREEFTGLVTSFLPTDRPRYLMGVGTPIDILEAVHRGVDMMDCIIPTQFAQRGAAFTSTGKIQLRRSVYRLSEEPLDSNCDCSTCQSYSRAYLHHLHKTDEVLGWHLIGLHNIAFYHRLMKNIRNAIVQQRFLPFYEKMKLDLVKDDDANPANHPRSVKKISKKEKNLKLGDYEVILQAGDISSIRQISSGETLHSVNRPTEEAMNLYVKPSDLVRRFQEGQPDDKNLIVWDVGLGAATNAMVLIHELLKVENPKGKIQIISFENDLDSLRLALKNPHRFEYLKHAAPATLLKDQLWINIEKNIEWKLVLGDFSSTYSTAPIPDVIFYDLFSSKNGEGLWGFDFLKKLKNYCLNQTVQLLTYSASTRVRSQFLAAGFYVAYGNPSGPKETTSEIWNLHPSVVINNGRDSRRWLGPEWLDRWSRSGAYRSDLDTLIQKHPQFIV